MTTENKDKTKGAFAVTDYCFNINRDSTTGLNRSQAESSGERYPLKTGWKERIIGKEITLCQKQDFEASKGLVYRVKKELTKNKRNSKIFMSQKEALTLEVDVTKLRLELKEIKEKMKL